jgi:hypothetical protein
MAKAHGARQRGCSEVEGVRVSDEVIQARSAMPSAQRKREIT